MASGLRLVYLVAPPDWTGDIVRAIRATIWNAPALISALTTGWIEDGKIRAVGRGPETGRQRLLRATWKDLSIVAYRNARFAKLPPRGGVRAEPIVTWLRDEGISVSAAEAFATTTGVSQAFRLAFGSVPMEELNGMLTTVRDAIEAVEST